MIREAAFCGRCKRMYETTFGSIMTHGALETKCYCGLTDLRTSYYLTYEKFEEKV